MLKFTQRQLNLTKIEREIFNNSNKALLESNKHILNSADALTREMIGNAYTLDKDAWVDADKRGIKVQRKKNVVMNALSAGSQKAHNFAFLFHQWERISDSGEVNISLDGASYAKEDQAVVDYQLTPVPILDSTASFSYRQYLAIRQAGSQLDTSSIENKMAKVADALEDIAINGSDKVKINGNPLYGLRNAPKRISGKHGVNFQTDSGEKILEAFKNMIVAFRDNLFYDGITFFLNFNDRFSLSAREFTAGYPMTILERVLMLDGIEEIIGAPKVPAGEVLGIIKSSEVYEVLNAMPITVVPLARHNMRDHYKFNVVASAAVEFKYDFNGRAGYAQFEAV